MQPPILTRVSSETGSGFERRFVISTYLTGTYSSRLPEPTNPNVFIERLPEMTVFVRRFQVSEDLVDKSYASVNEFTYFSANKRKKELLPVRLR